ncbi:MULTISPECIES: SpoIIAA family protein [Sphingomonadales]|uniref:STAS/SEC14 domain-containing protein n=2 Tax=Qipengyuania TaxID=1855416 RepID=A0A844Y8S1_9SPHN|nr:MULTISPECIES: STAS/SEC14 domain-containing protein [Sphingomonadales]MAB46634.1 STAS/SEC14 domain-containing protein [Sphingomonadaceae bacterium]MCV0384111.1 STAS/SEC14 domain-containing protein [Erythrobacter sp.]MXO54525.1 STAS/SEC14 domain-containing protein [Qipengyuania pelagi]PZT86202.1 MAG: STAS/SEC14 domain-containing protein [Citromicrobium sp.]MDG5751461.1 STAS/SEC14 domain-containing protein [Qipengyuania sp. XHP0211]
MLALKEENGLLWIRAGGRLEDEDYNRFVPQFERIAEREAGTVPMVIELAPDFSGWDLGGLWRDLKFDVRHKDCFGRIAIIGDSKWEEWGTEMSSSLFRAEMKFFQPSQRSHAESWVRTGEDAA